MRIYSKTGDGGTTGLVGGARVPKTDLRIRAIGEVDELNAAIGVAASCAGRTHDPDLPTVQSWLFDLGAEVASPSEGPPGRHWASSTATLERSIDLQWEKLPALKNFILPGGCPQAAALHVARGVCRRAEIALFALREQQGVADEILRFINRLSDWLFVCARTANANAGVEETVWRKGDE